MNIKKLKKKAKNGDVFSMLKLGNAYRFGHGTEIDSKKAFKLYKKAADLGDAVGWLFLGGMYENGEGTEMNYEKAFLCYFTASARVKLRRCGEWEQCTSMGAAPKRTKLRLTISLCAPPNRATPMATSTSVICTKRAYTLRKT